MAIAYLVGGWGLAQVLPIFNVPNRVIQLIVLLIAIGLPIAMVLAWAFELTPAGIKRTQDFDRADRAIELLQRLVVMPSYLNYARLKLHPMWNPLRCEPRFEKIVASLAPLH